MEALDRRVEVLNFGVPGYNAENVAHTVELTLRVHAPDLVVYVVNKNDVDRAHAVDESVLTSELLMRTRFFYQAVVTRSQRREERHSPARHRFLADQIDRIAADATARHVPLLLVFLKTRTWELARANAQPGAFTASASTDAHTDRMRRVIVAEDLLDPFVRVDEHLSAAAHRALAARLCAEIAAAPVAGMAAPVANRPPAACLPATWTPHDRAGSARLAQASLEAGE
jgi:hypothetical protein